LGLKAVTAVSASWGPAPRGRGTALAGGLAADGPFVIDVVIDPNATAPIVGFETILARDAVLAVLRPDGPVHLPEHDVLVTRLAISDEEGIDRPAGTGGDRRSAAKPGTLSRPSRPGRSSSKTRPLSGPGQRVARALATIL